MLGLRIRYDDHGADRRIAQLALFLSDLRSFWPRLVPIFIGWMREQFDTEGGFAGRPWAALAPSTLERKRELGLRTNILQATGQLKMAASNPRRTVTPTSLILTIDDSGEHHGPVLQYHQTGGGRLPARPLVFGDPLPAVARAQIRAEAEFYVRDLLRRL